MTKLDKVRTELWLMFFVIVIAILVMLAEPAKKLITMAAESGMSWEDYLFHPITRGIFWVIFFALGIINRIQMPSIKPEEFNDLIKTGEIYNLDIWHNAYREIVNLSKAIILIVSAAAIFQTVKGYFNIAEVAAYIVIVTLSVLKIKEYYNILKKEG